MESRRKCCTTGGCPFAYNDISEQIQNYGCLPSSTDILVMKVKYNKTWACHSNPTKPCLGSQIRLKEMGFEWKQVGELVTEDTGWNEYLYISNEELQEIYKRKKKIGESI
jgi:hypothetical protein